MTERLSERERTESIVGKMLWDEEYLNRDAWVDKITTWHLAEVKRIVEPLVSELNRTDRTIPDFKTAIDKTLKRANGGE